MIDYLLESGKKVLALETDTANPDVYKAHHPHESDSLICKIADLDLADGWIELVNMADEFPGHCLVINAAARSHSGMEKYGMTLRETLGELDRTLTTFWMVNRGSKARQHIEKKGRTLDFPDLGAGWPTSSTREECP